MFDKVSRFLLLIPNALCIHQDIDMTRKKVGRDKGWRNGSSNVAQSVIASTRNGANFHISILDYHEEVFVIRKFNKIFKIENIFWGP